MVLHGSGDSVPLNTGGHLRKKSAQGKSVRHSPLKCAQRGHYKAKTCAVIVIHVVRKDRSRFDNYIMLQAADQAFS
jgi:hypothetical protein